MLSKVAQAFLKGIFATISESTDPTNLVNAFLSEPSELDSKEGDSYSMAESFCSRFETRFGKSKLARIVTTKVSSMSPVHPLFPDLLARTLELWTPRTEYSGEDHLRTRAGLHSAGLKLFHDSDRDKPLHRLTESLELLALWSGKCASHGLTTPKCLKQLEAENPIFTEYFRCGIMLRDHSTEEAMEALINSQAKKSVSPTQADLNASKLSDAILDLMQRFSRQEPAIGIIRRLLEGLEVLPGGKEELLRVQRETPSHWCGHFDS